MKKSRREENKRREKSREGMACHCRNIEKEGSVHMLSNRFEMLRDKVMQKGEGSGRQVARERKEILREERAKKRVEVRQTKVERKEKKEKLLREVTVKIGLKQKEEEEGIVTKALLDSKATELVISEEFAKKHRFRSWKGQYM